MRTACNGPWLRSHHPPRVKAVPALAVVPINVDHAAIRDVNDGAGARQVIEEQYGRDRNAVTDIELASHHPFLRLRRGAVFVRGYCPQPITLSTDILLTALFFCGIVAT